MTGPAAADTVARNSGARTTHALSASGAFPPTSETENWSRTRLKLAIGYPTMTATMLSPLKAFPRVTAPRPPC